MGDEEAAEEAAAPTEDRVHEGLIRAIGAPVPRADDGRRPVAARTAPDRAAQRLSSSRNAAP